MSGVARWRAQPGQQCQILRAKSSGSRQSSTPRQTVFPGDQRINNARNGIKQVFDQGIGRRYVTSRHGGRNARLEEHVPSAVGWLAETAETEADDAVASSQPDNAPMSTTIVGGGPAGLATAIMLARMGYANVQVLERLSAPPPSDSSEWGNPERSYCLGVGGRGQAALQDLGCWDRVDKCAAEVNGSMDLKADGTSTIRLSQKSYVTQILQRDRLVSCLLEEISEKYSSQVSITYHAQCNSVTWKTTSEGKPVALMHCTKSDDSEGDGNAEAFEIETEFLVGADGARSTIPTAMEDAPDSKFRRTVHEDTNPRVYKTVTFKPADDWRKDMNFSSGASDKKAGLTMQALPTKEGLLMGLLLTKPGNPVIESVKTPQEAKQMFEQQFPQLVKQINEIEFEKFPTKPMSKLPVFQTCGPVLHHGATTVLVGDTIHTVKPYFGLGVNSAFEDVVVLGHCLKDANHRLGDALPEYSRIHTENARSLVRMSRLFDVGGFVGFVLPIILDGIFSKFAPSLFSPNNIRMLQRPDLSFAQIASLKRRDRILQAVIISGILAAMFKLAQFVFGAAFRFVASQGLVAA